MSLVRVKKKYQVVIPESVRAEIGVNVGDLLEAKAERGKIIFTPKLLVDRQIAEGPADLKSGRAPSSSRNAEETTKAPKRTAKKIAKKRGREK